MFGYEFNIKSKMAEDEKLQILQDENYLLQEECTKLGNYVNELEATQSSLLEKHTKSENSHGKSLHDFVADLFDNPLHSDIKILLNDGKEIFAHKLILASREFISHDKDINQTEVLDLSDMKYETVYKMLKWIYTDKLDIEKEEEFSELLELADEFHLQTLLLRCDIGIDNLINKNNMKNISEKTQKLSSITLRQHVNLDSETEINHEEIGIDDDDGGNDDLENHDDLEYDDQELQSASSVIDEEVTECKSGETLAEARTLQSSLTSSVKPKVKKTPSRTVKGNYSSPKPNPKPKDKKSKNKNLSEPKLDSSKNKCDVCDRSYPTYKQLLCHTKIHTENKYKCDVCSKSFYCVSHLKQHLRVHSGLKPYQCHVCGATFKQSGGLYSHRSIHTGVKSFSCDICDKIFRQKSALVLHQRTHTGEKSYVCEQCGKAFATKSQLGIHKRIHTGERPAVCETCNKSFISTNHLKRHIKTHTGEKTFKCEYCQKSFTNGYNLRRHIQTHRNRGIEQMSHRPLKIAIKNSDMK